MSLVEIGFGWRDWAHVGLTTGWPEMHGHAGWAGLRVRMSLTYPIVLLRLLWRGAHGKLRSKQRARGFPVIVEK